MRQFPWTPPTTSVLPGHLLITLTMATACLTGCGARQHQGPAVPTAPAVAHYEMEPIMIEAKPGATGLEVESFDAEELFEQGGAALSHSRYDDAVRFYDKILVKFPVSPYARPAL